MFNAKFVTNANEALGTDHMVLFFADNITSFKGHEFGLRFVLKSGIMFGYVQDGPQYFTQIPLVPHDGGTASLFDQDRPRRDGQHLHMVDRRRVKGSLTHSVIFDYTKPAYWTVMTTHRLTNGWDSTGDYMEVGDLRVHA